MSAQMSGEKKVKNSLFDAISFPFLHHAFCITGEREANRELLVRWMHDALSVDVIGNPDVHTVSLDHLAIDDARSLREIQETKALAAGERYFIVSFGSISLEAQNALLKMFEEPAAHSRFFILIPTLRLLLPTVRSRLFSFRGVGDTTDGVRNEAKEFVAAMIPARLKMAKKIADAVSDEEQTKNDVADFVRDIERVVHGAAIAKPSQAEALVHVLNAERDLSGRAASVKMILEHLALVIPRLT